MTSGSFCHSRATDYGVGFVTAAALRACATAAHGALPPRTLKGRGKGGRRGRGKKSGKARGLKQDQCGDRNDGAGAGARFGGDGVHGGKRAKSGSRDSYANTALALCQHPDSQTIRVVYLRVLVNSYLEE